MAPDDLEIARINRGVSTEALLEWVARLDGPVIATSSFQTQSTPFLHLLSKHLPEVPILFLDTGFHFPETLAYRDQLAEQLKLNLVNVVAPRVPLYSQDTEVCCQLNKVDPLQPHLDSAAVWLTGIRRDQTQQRRSQPLVTREASGRLKVCPMAAWTQSRIDDYLFRFELPEHPLTSSGYRSIGCAPCTVPTAVGQDARAGRWADGEKVECGIHFGHNPNS